MIYIILRIVLSTVNGNLTIPSTKTVIYYLLTTNSAYHLWFFALIVQFYVLYPNIMKVYNKFEESNKALYFVGLSLVFQLVWIVSVALIQDYLSSTAYFESIALFKFNHMVDRLFPSQMFYFILGIYACKNYKAVIEWVLNIKKWSLSIGLPIILVSLGTISALFINGIIEYGDYTKLPNSYFMAKALIESLYFPLVFLVFLVISLEFENVKNTYADIILSIGKYSFGIYLIHVVFIEIIIQVIYPYLGIGYNQWIFYPVLFLISLLLSYFSVRQISLTSYSEMIVGIKNAGPEPKLPA